MFNICWYIVNESTAAGVQEQACTYMHNDCRRITYLRPRPDCRHVELTQYGTQPPKKNWKKRDILLYMHRLMAQTRLPIASPLHLRKNTLTQTPTYVTNRHQHRKHFVKTKTHSQQSPAFITKKIGSKYTHLLCLEREVKYCDCVSCILEGALNIPAFAPKNK
jgi:hypothetical protein